MARTRRSTRKMVWERSENKACDDTLAVRKYAWDRIGDHEGAQLRGTIRMFEAARLFNFTYVKLHPLDISDVEILEDVFSFVNTDVVHNRELEKADYNIAASNADARSVGFLV